MEVSMDELMSRAMQLNPEDWSELFRRLILSLDAVPEDTPEAIAKAWDEEIARRVADMEAGRTQWIPAEEVLKRLDATIAKYRK